MKNSALRFSRGSISLSALCLCLAAAVSGRAAPCAPGQRTFRSGTMTEPGGRTWAVVRDCRHPGWPAHLEPAALWADLPARVPQDSAITVTLPGCDAILSAKTAAPGRVGDLVPARLINGALRPVRLTSAKGGRVEIAGGSAQPASVPGRRP